jgi:hypothetical protein
VTPEISSRKDDCSCLTGHNSRNASNSRNESNNRTANRVGTEAKVGMLAKVGKATARKEASYSWKSLTAEMTAAAGIIGTSWMSTAVGPPELDRRKVGIITSREDNNIRRGHQQQQQELTTITLGTTAETTGISQTSTVEGRPATAEMPDSRAASNSTIASAGAPTSQYRVAAINPEFFSSFF